MKKAASFTLAALLLALAGFFSRAGFGDEGSAAARLTPAAAPVRSQLGTGADGAVASGAADGLRVDLELRRWFDYHLAGLGEKNLDDIRAAMEQELRARLDAAGAAHALDVLKRYLDYRAALAGLERNTPSGNTAHAIRARFLGMQKLRQAYFSDAENQAFFGLEDALDADALARLEITQDSALAPAEKQRRLQALDANMAPSLRAEKEAPYQVQRLHEQTENMRSAGASEDEIYRARAAATTPEAAARLAQLDREEMQWRQRIATYLQQRQALLAAQAGAGALQRLREQSFDESERKRLAAYE